MAREYAQAGVNPDLINPFKQIMAAMGERTLPFPLHRRQVRVERGDHGAIFNYTGTHPHGWAQTTEGLGNKNWVAEWMAKHAGTGRTYYEGIGIDTALMAANDVIAQGALPAVYTDEVAAGNSEWFANERRARDLAEGFHKACELCGMALAAGESPALRYLVKAELPVESAPVLSGTVTGIIAPWRRCMPTAKIEAGDHILGVTSSGIHANGISAVIRRAMELPDKFLTLLPNGYTLGHEALTPTRSYVALAESLFNANVEIHALLPGTGDGVSKIAVHPGAFTYYVHHWVNVPPLFLYMRELGMTLQDCLTTFNWGIGYYIFVPPTAVKQALKLGAEARYDIRDIGVVENGERQVIFEPERITLPPPNNH